MSDLERPRVRRLKLPFLEMTVEKVEPSEDGRVADSDSLVAEESAATRGLSADWHGTLPMAGLLALGLALTEQNWGVAAAGAAATAVGVWLMSRRLRHRNLTRKTGWIAVDLGLGLAGIGLVVAFDGSWWSYLLLIGCVLLAPTAAGSLFPEEG